MIKTKPLSNIIYHKDIKPFRYFMYELHKSGKIYFLRNDIIQTFDYLSNKESTNGVKFSKESSLYRFFIKTQEIILAENRAVFLHRREIAKYMVYVVYENSDIVEEDSISQFLDLKDNIVVSEQIDPSQKVTIDFHSFYDYGPSINDSKKVGAGIDFLNNYMSGLFIHNHEKFKKTLYEFLKIHLLNEQQLLINEDIIKNENELLTALKEVLLWLDERQGLIEFSHIKTKITQLGFNPGFGNTQERITETLHLLMDLMEDPSSKTLDQFITKIPMVSKIAIISPHGWFCQENVMGRPDTGGQVIYILDQVRALERELLEELDASGLSHIAPKIIVITRLIPDNEGTTSDHRLEKIHNTRNCWILRVPFINKNKQVVNHWISRFKIWNYLERFSLDVKKELLSEFGGKPDLIIGNYSDGNLVASLLSQQLSVIQCNIAHALEKTKYLFSALYWQELESQYNFSVQFTADLISMNMANFIVTSTLQEIVGTKNSIGQYESYQFFTMPDLYKVTGGVNLFHPRFNVIPPGVDDKVYFPYYQKEDRVENNTKDLINLLFHEEGEDIYGHFDDQGKSPVFSMSRLDKVKNISGLVEAFGKSEELQKMANLIIIAGRVHAHQITDKEEHAEMEKVYYLIETYKLQGKVRWIGSYLPRHDTGEIYRIIAQRGGVFVQPALFEAFGLTILEAMASGLPVFATQFGGPLEIIEDKKCGFLINPTDQEMVGETILSFFSRVKKEPAYWKEISTQAILRVKNHYNWRLYAKNMLRITKLYGFWKYSSSIKGKKKMAKYCELLFHLIFKKRAEHLE